jgi:hypothetical protein
VEEEVIYPDWKAQTEMYLGRKIESGWETEYFWALYDYLLSPLQATAEYKIVAMGPKIVLFKENQ